MLSQESDANLDLIRVSATPLHSSDSAEESGCETLSGGCWCDGSTKEAERQSEDKLQVSTSVREDEQCVCQGGAGDQLQGRSGCKLKKRKIW